MTEQRLEPVRVAQLLAYAENGIQSIDAYAIATSAMGKRRRWSSVAGRRLLVVAVVGLLAAAAVGLTVVGAFRTVTPAPRPLTPLAVPPMDPASFAVRLQDGRVLIAGTDSSRAVTDQQRLAHDVPAAWIWDEESGAFTPTGDPLETRPLAAGALLPDGNVLLAGGGGGYDQKSQRSSAELYDPKTGRFRATTSMSDPRGWAPVRGWEERPSAVALADGRVFLIGGSPAVGAADVFDPKTERFASFPPVSGCDDGMILPVRRADGRVLIRCDQGDSVYNPTDDSFRRLGASIAPTDVDRVNLGAASLLRDGRVLFTGSFRRTATGIWADGPAELFDPATGTFSALAGAANPRGVRVSVTVNDGRVLLVVDGGQVFLFDPVTKSFATPAIQPAGILHPDSATLLDDGRVLIIGSDEDGVVHAGVFDPTAPAALGTLPSATPAPVPATPVVNSDPWVAHEAFLPGASEKDLFLVHRDGSGRHVIVGSAPGEHRGPAWSPDGAKIAFVTRDDATPDGSIWIADADGTNPHQLFDPAEACPWGAWWPSWSPDGQAIAIVCYTGQEGVSALAVVDVESLATTIVRSLTFPEGLDTPPTWSPDGSTLAFGILHWDPTNSFLDGSLIATIPADGSSEPTRLGTFDSFEASPDWHPTDALIAFNTYELGNIHETTHPSNIYTMRPDGSQRRQLTTISTDGMLRIGQPRWNSEGTELVATLAHGSPTEYVEVVLVNAATGAVTKPPTLVPGARPDAQPKSWDPTDQP